LSFATWDALSQTKRANEQTDLAVGKTKEAQNQAQISRANESRALAALSFTALQGRNPYDAFKLALAAWPRSASDSRPRLRRTVQALSRATAGPLALLPVLKHDDSVTGALFDKAEARILSWSGSETRLWDAAIGQPIGAPMKHDAWVNGALFDKAEARILSWSGSETRLWDAATGQPIGAPMKHDAEVRGARFDKAEARILSWSDDRTVRLWDAARLMHGNLIEVGCELLADKNVETLHKDFGIKVTESICNDHGKDAPAPDVRELYD
jgi:WD40 repeat protein